MLKTLTPADVAARMKAGEMILIDIREADEFAREHVAGSRAAPLSGMTGEALGHDKPVVFTCRTGNRTGMNAAKLAACVPGEAYVLEGGLEAWKAAGLPVRQDRKAPLEIMRQVQMTAGGLILLGAALGLLVHPGFWALSAFVGAGLFVAGATGFCGMATLLAAMPWNRKARAA